VPEVEKREAKNTEGKPEQLKEGARRGE